MRLVLGLLGPPAIAALLAYAVAPIVARVSVRVGAVDMPNARKIHGVGMPRLGGLAVIAAIAIVWTLGAAFDHAWALPPELAAGIGLGVLPILAVSLVDDIRPVPARLKILFHLIGAGIAVQTGVSLNPQVHLFGQPFYLGWLAAPISVAWMVGVTNAFNIIDGLDGLSAGLSLIAALSMAAVFGVVGQPAMASACLVLTGALAGFLPYNFFPARLFLGDTGATTIGFCLAVFALEGGSTLSSGFAALVPVFILGLPIADTVLALIRRTVLRLEGGTGGVFEADRDHIHHRLLALGLTHTRAVLLLYGAGLLLAVTAFASIFLSTRQAALFIMAIAAAGFAGMRRLGYDELAFIRRGTMLKAYELPVLKRSLFIVFADLAMAMVAAYVAIGLKHEIWNPAQAGEGVLALGGIVAPLTVIIFLATGIYRGSWRFATLHDLMRACSSVTLVTVAALISRLFLAEHLPWTVFLVWGLVSLILVVSSRASYVVLRAEHNRASAQGLPVLIYGAGASGTASVQELFESPALGLRPVGFIDDDPGKRGKLLHGIPVLGSWSEAQALVSKHNARGVVIAMSNLSPRRVTEVADVCHRLGVGLLRTRFQVELLVDVVVESAPRLASPPVAPRPAAHAPGR